MDQIIRYDPRADILVLKIRKGETIEEELLDNDILIGKNRKGEITTIEVWDASKKGLLNILIELAHQKHPVIKTILKPTKT